MKGRLTAGGIAAALLLGGCQTLSDGYDRLFGSSGPVQKPAELTPIQPQATLRVLWQGNVGPADKGVFYPARSGNVVYAAGAGGGVAGFDVARGTPVARFEAGQRISGGAGAGGGLVLVGTAKGEVLAFDSEGRARWRAQLSGEVLAAPEVQEGIVVARSGDGRIHGLDAANGAQRWVYQRTTPTLSVRTHAGVIVERGAIFAGFAGGRLVAIALAGGQVGWEAAVAIPKGATELERVADITSRPAFDGQRVCAVAFQGRVACFDASRGSLLWARDVSSLAGLAVDDRNVYVTDDRNAVVALSKASGASLWRQDRLAGRNVSGPLAIGRFVVVGDLEGYVHLLSREDGSFAARLATDGSPILAPPIAVDLTTFVVQTRSGGVYAISVQ